MSHYRIGQMINNAIIRHPWLWHPYNLVYEILYHVPYLGEHIETIDTFRDPNILQELEESRRDYEEGWYWTLDSENNKLVPSPKLREEGEIEQIWLLEE
ncbi:MAG: hypothetical protein U9M95_01990 [Candidatus Altiarchaeota archaeon]|nr:hypothetical protein [Candidatus Altiarchaeota archaeon]